ncbi:MAG: ATP-binding protein [Clostridiales bacterium]|nr:ATP-binding protein [Clostridiales bacterium]
MLPTINGKPIIECSKEDFAVIIDNPDYSENEYLDYKRSFSFLDYPGNNPQRAEHIAEFKTDVCAFANADGGYLIYGIKERNGVASELVGVEIPNNNTDKFELERMNNLQSILPKIPSVNFRFILLDNGRYLVVILIQRDAFAPYIHLCNEKDYKIYKRVGNGKTAMSYSEMKMQFSQALSLSQEIERFRKERISYYQSIGDDSDEDYSRFILLHIIPDTFLDPSHNKPMYVNNRLSNPRISSIFNAFSCASFTRSNADGLRSSGYDGKTEGQIYNSGIAECFIPVREGYISRDRFGSEFTDFFAYEAFWENMETMVNAYAETLANILDTDRVFVCLSIIGCRGVLTSKNFTVQESTKIDRSMMIMNPVVFNKIKDEDSVSISIIRLKVEYHLAIGIGLSSEEIRMIERGQI